MAFSVRVFTYKGISQVQLNQAKQYNSDSVFVLDEPYLWSQVISVSAAAASSAPVSNDGSTVMRLEVPDGQQVRYEINPNGPSASNARIAGNSSPRTSGADVFAWGPGFSISLIDAAGLP